MKITAQQIMSKLEDGQFEADLVTKKNSELSVTEYKAQAKRMITFVENALNSGALAQVQFHIDGRTPITFALETNIINLPFSNWKKINNFFDEEAKNDVNVYFEIASDYINVSRFRIDEFATSAELLENADKFVPILADLMQEKVEFIKENEVEMKQIEKEKLEAAKVAEANKKAEAKKTAKKKTTTKKTTAKKKSKK